MPTKSKAQKRLMDAVAADPAFAKRVNISQKVGRDFVNADKALGKRNGGVLADKMPNIRMAKGSIPKAKSAMLIGRMPKTRMPRP